MKLGTLLSCIALVCVPASAQAAKVVTTKLQAGTGGPYQKGDETGKDYAGPGTEQPTTAWIQDPQTGVVDVVTVWMSSDVSTADRPWQGKCSLLELGKTGSPKLLVDQKQITQLGDPNNADERPFNHPHLTRVSGAKNGTGLFLLTYGSDADNNGNVQTYAVLMDRHCNLVSGMVRISGDANNNEGAPEAVEIRPGYVVAGYYDNNAQRTYAIPLMIDDTDPAKPKVVKLDTPKTIVTPSDIGRPTLAAITQNRALLCAAKGNNRPPELGVECAYLAVDGAGKLTTVWKQYIDQSNPAQGIYYNQPTARNCGPNTVCILTLHSNGKGKNTNQKGLTKTTFSVVTVDDNGMQIKGKREGVGLNQSHSGLCSGQFGVDGGSLAAVVYDAPITGAGQPGAQIVRYDAVSKKIEYDPQKEYYSVGFVADSGHLANVYGQNPNVQGRDFMRCIGDIPNPGFDQTGGWQADAQTFFAFPHSGRIKKTDAEPKNALYLTLFPGATKVPLVPTPPVAIEEVPAEAPPADPEPSTGSGTSTAPSLNLPEQSSGCAMGGSSDRGGMFAVLLALAALARARRKS
jgi:MYXO-CTERM domain-containing protein